MNKKILSIFALIMALSFAVSCSNEETTGTGGGSGTGSGNPTQITDSQILEVLKAAFNGVEINDSSEALDTSSATFNNGVFAVSIDNTTAKGKKSTTATNLKAKDGDLTTALDGIGITLEAGQQYTVVDSSEKGTVTLNITVKDGYKLPAGTTTTISIEITLTGSSNNSWEA